MRNNGLFAVSNQYKSFKKNTGLNISLKKYKQMRSGITSAAARKGKTLTNKAINEKIEASVYRKFKKAQKQISKEGYSIKFSAIMKDQDKLAKDIISRSTQSEGKWEETLKKEYLNEYSELGYARINQVDNLAKEFEGMNLKEFSGMSKEEIAEKLKKLSAQDFQKMLGKLNVSNEDMIRIMGYDEQYGSYNEYMKEYNRAYRAAHRRVN